MSDQKNPSDLNLETGVLAWSELARYFARGVVVKVDAALDLVETADIMVKDDASTIQRWLDTGLLARASDDDARDWTTREPEFWCIVAAPWVLVQECERKADPTLH